MFSFGRRNATTLSTFSTRLLATAVALATAMLSTGRLHAHEVWIEPVKTQLAKGDTLVADLRIDVFKGDTEHSARWRLTLLIPGRLT